MQRSAGFGGVAVVEILPGADEGREDVNLDETLGPSGGAPTTWRGLLVDHRLLPLASGFLELQVA